MKPGYVYAVCNQGNYGSVKIGFTTLLAVEGYLHAAYSRSLTPLEIIFVMPAANARLSESVMHHLLAQHRVDQNHELFDLSAGLQQLWDAKETMMLLDVTSKLPVPVDRPVNIQYWKLAKEAAKEGDRRLKLQQEKLRAAMLKEEKERMKQDKVDKIKIEEEAKRQQAAEAYSRGEASKVQQSLTALQSFLGKRVQQGGPRDYVKVCDLFLQYCQDNRALQADRKTKKTQKMFEEELHKCLGTELFKPKHQYRSCGRVISANKVFMTFKGGTKH